MVLWATALVEHAQGDTERALEGLAAAQALGEEGIRSCGATSSSACRPSC